MSESRFSIHTQGRQAPTGLASLFAGGVEGFSISNNAGNAVTEYVQSRDAMHALDRSRRLESIFNRPGVDLFQRVTLFSEPHDEDLFSYYSKRVKINYDGKSGIVSLQVEAFDPADARWMNESLLRQSEQLVNAMNQRSREDLVQYARADVDKARSELERASAALAAYRNRIGLVDPQQEAAVSLQMISKLQDEVIQARTQVSQLSVVAPRSTQIPVLRERSEFLDEQIRREMAKVVGQPGSMASRQGEYTKKVLDVGFAEKLLASSLASLQSAQAEVTRQQAYVERIVQPSIPDKPAKPERLKSILSVFILGMVSWGVLKMLLSATKEHNL